ncbi:hypothetical protein ASG89_28105 [Paenibacillus sp. Soil766]|uniref:hypothetical protein n=1 Tax=Paenibacillus sp. Soil766 TaxID=1736404 RepID=UPI00070AF75F|nr:hypothetical protein [Paenibacillus sp. Soil766]KRE99426.1 hypothetical protein ASG89_28105 [Paenibacillus sp. Soil766]
MKNNKWLNIIFAISILGNFLLAFFLNNKNESDRQTMEQIAFRGIQSNFIQLEGSITYQMETGWGNQSYVTEKLEDVMEGIGLIIEIGNRSGALNKDNENLLRELQDYLSDYKEDTGFPNAVLSDKERDDFIKLAEKLRSSGWGMNLGYGSSWKDFEQKTRKLLN